MITRPYFLTLHSLISHLSVLLSSTWVITLNWLGLGSDMRKVGPGPRLSAMLADPVISLVCNEAVLLIFQN